LREENILKDGGGKVTTGLFNLSVDTGAAKST